MRDPLAPEGGARPRYVIECHNKERHDGQGLREFNECDAYVLGCFARTCGSAISWSLGNMMHSKLEHFAARWAARPSSG